MHRPGTAQAGQTLDRGSIQLAQPTVYRAAGQPKAFSVQCDTTLACPVIQEPDKKPAPALQRQAGEAISGWGGGGGGGGEGESERARPPVLFTIHPPQHFSMNGQTRGAGCRGLDENIDPSIRPLGRPRDRLGAVAAVVAFPG